MSHRATYSPEDNKLRLYPAHRLDADEYAKVKAAGFKWAPKQELFVAPMWTPEREDLLTEMAGEIEDEDTSLVERQEARAERFEEYAENRKEDSNRAHDYVKSIADGIPFGQPILIGHHSERRARRDAERIENGMRKAVTMWKQSEYWKDRAQGAIRHAKFKELPGVRARRIKGLEADLRARIASYTPHINEKTGEPMRIMQQAWHDRYPLNGTGNPDAPDVPHVWVGPKGRGGHWVAERSIPAIKAYAERWIEHLSNRLEYERAMLKESTGVDDLGLKWDLQIGGRVLCRGEWSTILRITKKDGRPVSVTTNARYVSRRGVDEISDYQAPTEEQAANTAAAMKQKPLLNYRAPEGIEVLNPWKSGETMRIPQIELTQAQYTAIGSDYRSSYITADKTHRVRYTIKGGNRVCVFIVDSKTHAIPATVAPTIELTPAGPMTSEEIADALQVAERSQEQRAKQAAEDAERAHITALEQSLKGGVQTVSAPQLFPTPPEIARRMVELADVQPGECVLEPSAGTGNIVAAVIEAVDTEILAYEINYNLASLLERKFPSYRLKVNRGDFLEATDFQGCYPVVLMNPPFENGADIKHIQHALTFLKPGGRLVAICANGPRQQEKLRPIADTWEELPPGTFHGTQVRAVLLSIRKCLDCAEPIRSDEETMLRNNGALSHLEPCEVSHAN